MDVKTVNIRALLTRSPASELSERPYGHETSINSGTADSEEAKIATQSKALYFVPQTAMI
jgi:hypothetical protein